MMAIRWRWPLRASSLTSDSLVLRWLAWGDRRYADGTPQPPLKINASLGLWLGWVLHRPKGMRLVSQPRVHERAFVRQLPTTAVVAPELSLSEAVGIDAQRQTARASRNFVLADALRDRLTGAGYFVEDAPARHAPAADDTFVWGAPEPIEAALQGRYRERPVNLLRSGAQAHEPA